MSAFKVEVIAIDENTKAELKMHVYCNDKIEFNDLLMQLNTTMHDWIDQHYPHVTLLDKAISEEKTPGILRHNARLKDRQSAE